jgi:hypothetical protein
MEKSDAAYANTFWKETGLELCDGLAERRNRRLGSANHIPICQLALGLMEDSGAALAAAGSVVASRDNGGDAWVWHWREGQSEFVEERLEEAKLHWRGPGDHQP